MDTPLQQPSTSQEHIINPPHDKVSSVSEEVNVYPLMRNILLVVSVLFAISIILLLIYQNGKSIYENGI